MWPQFILEFSGDLRLRAVVEEVRVFFKQIVGWPNSSPTTCSYKEELKVIWGQGPGGTGVKAGLGIGQHQFQGQTFLLSPRLWVTSFRLQ